MTPPHSESKTGLSAFRLQEKAGSKGGGGGQKVGPTGEDAEEISWHPKFKTEHGTNVHKLTKH